MYSKEIMGDVSELNTTHCVCLYVNQKIVSLAGGEKKKSRIKFLHFSVTRSQPIGFGLPPSNGKHVIKPAWDVFAVQSTGALLGFVLRDQTGDLRHFTSFQPSCKHILTSLHERVHWGVQKHRA